MKKKFTMLFAALLAFAGVAKAGVTDLPKISTVENPIYYTIVNTRSSQPGGLMYYAGDNVGLKDEQTIVLEDKHKFFFTGSHEEMYVHNAATGLKLASVSSWTEAGAAWTVGVSPKGGGLAFGPKGGLNSNDCWNEKNFATDANTSDFTTWSANDDGSIFIVDLAEDYVFPVSDLFYVIEAPLFEKVQGVKKALYVNAEGKAAWATEDLKNNNFYWIPTVKDGKVALKNLGTDTYLSNTDGDMTDAVAEATLKILGDCSFNINIGGGTLHANGHGNGASANGTLTSWGGGIGSASAWSFVQKNDPTALVEVAFTYSFVYEGVEKCSQNCNTFVGEEYPAITVAFPYGVSAVKPEGEVTADIDGKKVTIDLSVNLPFTYNDGSYYYIKNKGEFYLHYDATLNHIPLTNDEKTVDATNKDAYSWSFNGDPFHGFYIINKLGGDYAFLHGPTSVEDNGANAYVVVKNGNNNEGYHHTLVLTKSTYAENGFFIAIEGQPTYRMNNRNGKLAYWTGGADMGSTFTVELRDDAAALQALIDAAEASLATWDQTGVGYATVSAEHKAAISEAIAAAEAAIANKTGYDAAEVALKAAVAAAKPYTIQPEEGVFYALKNNYTGRYMNVSASAGLIATTAVGIGEVFEFVKDNGSLYLKNVERGTFLSTAVAHTWGQNSAGATTIDGAKAVAVENLGKDNQVSITPVGGGQLHHDTNYNTVVAWNSGVDSKSSWSIEAVDITALSHVVSISDVKWATLVLGYDAIIPAGVTAYAVTDAGNGVAQLTEVTGVLPAYEAVLLNATEAGSYDFKYAESAEAVEGNLLAGSTIDMNVEGLGYVLAAKEGNVGLYKAALNVSTDKTNDGTEEEPAVTYEAFKNNAFKAYLPVAADEEAPAMFVFSRGGDDESTGIDQLINNGEVVIYDLAGRRVEKMEKGIYIVNGKKVVK